MFSTESSDTGAASVSQTPEHHDQQIDRENPDQDDLPEPQIARAIVIGGNVWVARKKSLPVFEDVKSREDYNHKADAKKYAQCQQRFRVGMDGCKDRIHLPLIRICASSRFPPARILRPKLTTWNTRRGDASLRLDWRILPE